MSRQATQERSLRDVGRAMRDQIYRGLRFKTSRKRPVANMSWVLARVEFRSLLARFQCGSRRDIKGIVRLRVDLTR